MLIRRAEVDGRYPVSVRIEGEYITAVAPQLKRLAGEPEIDADRGALVPGLHDHHIHLLATAAADNSLPCGRPAINTAAELAGALANDDGEGWLRGVGYHESVAGDLDRDVLDRLLPGRPLRIQHRSGGAWFVNSAAIRELGLEAGVAAPAGVERDARGRVTGRLFRCDDWLRQRLGTSKAPRLRALGRRLASLGITGVTDATASNGPGELALITDAVACGDLHCDVLVMGARSLPRAREGRVRTGAVKIVLDERSLPSLDDLRAEIADAHENARAVAIHCVGRAELVLAAGALEASGVHPGDRIEHASLAPPDMVALVANLGVNVVTQPAFIYSRGDDYLREVGEHERRWLYRLNGFLEAGLALAGSSDSPFGELDPWLAMKAAVSRETRAGRSIGSDERLSSGEALALFLSRAEEPGGRPRRVAVGERADLCLLTHPWSAAHSHLSSELVRATIYRGRVVFERD